MDKDKQMLISLTYSVRDLKKMKSPVILSTDNFIIFNTSMHQKKSYLFGISEKISVTHFSSVSSVSVEEIKN